MDRVLDKVEVVLDYTNAALKPTVTTIIPYVDSFNAEMQPIINRPIDWILFLYFSSHIPITLLFDLQAIYPDWIVPLFLKQVNGSYVQFLKDPFMDTQSGIAMYWFKSFAYCEAVIQLPFFFFAAYGVFKNKSWIRLPLAVYGAHVMTTVIPCLVEVICNQEMYGLSDFQRNCIVCLYFPYFLIPAIGLVDSFIRIQNRLEYIDQQQLLEKNK